MNKRTAEKKRNREPMICSECDTEMNRHAEKVREPRTPEEAAAIDPALGGLLVEHHTCAGCGRGAARRRR